MMTHTNRQNKKSLLFDLQYSNEETNLNTRNPPTQTNTHRKDLMERMAKKQIPRQNFMKETIKNQEKSVFRQKSFLYRS